MAIMKLIVSLRRFMSDLQIFGPILIIIKAAL